MIPRFFYERIKDLPKEEPIAMTRDGNKLKLSARRRVWESFKRSLNIAMGCKVYRNELIPPFPLSEDLVPYDLRHEFCTELARNGVDLRDAQYLMGHSDVQLTANIYTNYQGDEIALKIGKTEAKEEIPEQKNQKHDILKRSLTEGITEKEAYLKLCEYDHNIQISPAVNGAGNYPDIVEKQH